MICATNTNYDFNTLLILYAIQTNYMGNKEILKVNKKLLNRKTFISTFYCINLRKYKKMKILRSKVTIISYICFFTIIIFGNITYDIL